MTVKASLQANGVAIICLEGRLDLRVASEVFEWLRTTVNAGHHRLIVDLAQVSFVDSSGLSALIGGLKMARQVGGDLRVARLTEQPRQALQLTTLDRVLHPYDTIEQALIGL